VARFSAPPEAAGAVEWLTRLYIEKLMQEGPFGSIKPLDASAPSWSEAMRLGRLEKCDLVLAPEILSLLDSSGAAPTELEVRVHLFEVASGRLLVSFRQEAASEPGADIDLVWSILRGQSALRLHQLADMLAAQNARLFASMAGPALLPGGK
jgi:hypothetical protein